MFDKQTGQNYTGQGIAVYDLQLTSTYGLFLTNSLRGTSLNSNVKTARYSVPRGEAGGRQAALLVVAPRALAEASWGALTTALAEVLASHT